MTPFSFVFEIPVRNEWTNVDLVRASIENCLTAMFFDFDARGALAMVTGELLENAVKYGHWQGAGRTFRLCVRGDERQAQIEVVNPISSAEQARPLLEMLQWMRSFTSPQEAFHARVEHLAQRDRTDGTSQLGLLRIAYEGGCNLQARVEEGELTLIAVMAFASSPLREQSDDAKVKPTPNS